MQTVPRAPRAQAESGAILVTSLIFLVVLTMFVLAMVRSGTLEERMARNARDQQVALEAAEAVLREAEGSLFAGPPFDPYNPAAFSATCDDGLCYKPMAGRSWRDIDWNREGQTRTFDAASAGIARLAEQPRYIVEIVRAPFRTSSAGQCEHGLARITARGVGNGGATALVESTVRFRVFSNICD